MTSDRIISLAPLAEGKHYQSFSLYVETPGISLLPDEHELVVNVVSGHFMLINWNVRYVVIDGLFSTDELAFMLLLLSDWPSYVPLEKLLQAVNCQSAEQIVQLLDRERDQAVALLHDLAEHCRRCLRPFGIDVQNVHGLGYKLSRYYSREGQA